jgi:hypothetical protein
LEEWISLGGCGSWISGFHRVHSPVVFIQLSKKSHANNVTSAKYKFWWCKIYKVEDKV